MKVKLVLFAVVVLLIVAAVWYVRHFGVTNEQVVQVVDGRADEIIEHVDVRSGALERKLDRIEQKLDRLLDLANRPLADEMKRAD